MARVSIPSKDQVSDELKRVFQSMEERGGQVLNIHKVMAHCPNVGRAFLRLGNAILVGDLAEATYEWTQHVPLGLKAGLTDEQIETLHRWKDSSLFSVQERAVFQYTDEVTQNICVSEKTFNAIREFLTEEQVIELTTTIGYYGMVSRILEALEIELEENKPPLR